MTYAAREGPSLVGQTDAGVGLASEANTKVAQGL